LKKSKTQIALRVLEAGHRLIVSSGHEIAMDDNGHLCVVARDSENKEIGMKLDWSFNAMIDEFNKMDEAELFLRAAAVALKEGR
jgi:hypothetical protein